MRRKGWLATDAKEPWQVTPDDAAGTARTTWYLSRREGRPTKAALTMYAIPTTNGRRMPRRYTCTDIAMFQTRDVPVTGFPIGDGPPVYITVRGPDWSRLSPGQGAQVPHTGEHGGAYAWGLVSTVVAIWMHLPPDGPGESYCHHLVPGRLTPGLHERACELIGWTHRREAINLWVVLASHGPIEEAHERAFLAQGVLDHRLVTYSNASVPQFGVSFRGCVGEAF